MNGPKFLKISSLLALLVSLGMLTGNAQVPSLSPGPKTPTNLEVQVNSLDIGTDPLVPTFNIFDAPKKLDVITANGLPDFSEFGNGAFRKDNYRVIRILMEGTAQYRGFNPCDGSEVPLDSDIFFPDGIPRGGPDNTIEIDYNAPVPGTDLRPGAILISRFSIRSEPTEIRLVFFATDSVICASSQEPIRLADGADDGLENPAGVSVDVAGNRVFVSNDATHEIKAYTNFDPLNPTVLQELFTIRGSNTEMDRPGGIHYDPVNDEVVVVSSGERESLAAFRTDIVTPNPLPRTIIKGTNTGLNEPSDVFVDLTHGEFIASNIGDNSLTFYDRTDFSNAKPKRVVEGFSTGLSEPSGLFYDDINDWIIVTNAAKDTIGFFDRSHVIAETDAKMVTVYDFPPAISLIGPKTRLNRPLDVFLDDSIHYTGTASGGTSTSLIVASPVFSVDQFFYNRVFITAGTGAGENRIITGNLDDRLLVSPAWSVPPDGTSQFEIRGDNLFVSNNEDDRILIFSLQDIRDNLDGVTQISETAPIFTLKGKDTRIRLPQHIFVDPSNGEIFVANNDAVLDTKPDSVVVLKRTDRTVQIEKLPRLVNSGTQQFFFPRYYSSGELDEFGLPFEDGFGDPVPPVRKGYDMSWQVTDDRLRQERDVSEARLIPPSENVFQLADGSFTGTLDLDCTQFIPFFEVHLFTNCPPLPLTFLPYPLPTAIYEVPAVVLGEALFNKINFVATPRDSSDFPVPFPSVTLTDVGPNKVIDRIDWYYKGEENPLVTPYPPLMNFSQGLIIELKDTVNVLNPCFVPIGGGSGTIVFAEPEMDPLVRSVLEVKNNQCEIFYEDVKHIQIVVRDALENNFIYNWVPVLP